MALLASLALLFLLDLLGAYLYRRRHPGTTLEAAALAVLPGSASLAAAFVNLIVVIGFVVRLAPDEEAKAVFRQYMVPGSSVDMVLGVIGTGGFILFLYAIGSYRKALQGPPAVDEKQ